MRRSVQIAGLATAMLLINVKFPVAPRGTPAAAIWSLPSPTAFGFGLNEDLTPTGSARFLEYLDLEGNLYNNANLGGYLAWQLAPRRPIFQYNFPPVFGDVTRFVQDPGELDRWNIDIAFAGSNRELTVLFPRDAWAWIYSDYVSTLVVRRCERFRTVIEQYELQYFSPEQSLADYRSIVADPAARARLAFEMSVHCAFKRDARLWDRLQVLVLSYPGLVSDERTRYFLGRGAELQEVRPRQ